MSEYIVELNENPTITVDGWNVRCDDWLIQREEIVRCRDCKFAIINSLGDCKYCEKFWDSDGNAQLNLPGDFFCAWGERRGR